MHDIICSLTYISDNQQIRHVNCFPNAPHHNEIQVFVVLFPKFEYRK